MEWHLLDGVALSIVGWTVFCRMASCIEDCGLEGHLRNGVVLSMSMGWPCFGIWWDLELPVSAAAWEGLIPNVMSRHVKDENSRISYSSDNDVPREPMHASRLPQVPLIGKCSLFDVLALASS